MLGSLESFRQKPEPVEAAPPPIYIANGALVAVTEPNRTIAIGPPICEIVEGMPQWFLGSRDHRLIYRELKASLEAMNRTFTQLNGRLIYRTRIMQRRRIPMAYSGLLVNRMTQLVDEIRPDDFDPKVAVKLYQMLGEHGRAVMEDHLFNGPIIDEGYELSGYQTGLVQLGLLTRCVIKGKTGLTVANVVALRLYNTAIDAKKERKK